MSQRPGRNGRINAGRRSKGSGQVPVEHNARSRGKKPMFPAFAPSQCDLTDRYKSQGNSSDLYENNQLYVSNLPPETNMEEVSRVFPDCVSIRLGVNNSNEQLAAYLEFPDPITTERASNQARGACIRGQYLIVSPKLKCN
ncbi:Nucleolin [Orchesella cincta]|uniref:Nucleolin n=1 Tax=Orchesella cincta TaxID=48709 RepID=A0A1D2MEB2_ORCCI|nr:Nucleolin [Orchesella cincta]